MFYSSFLDDAISKNLIPVLSENLDMYHSKFDKMILFLESDI